MIIKMLVTVEASKEEDTPERLKAAINALVEGFDAEDIKAVEKNGDTCYLVVED